MCAPQRQFGGMRVERSFASAASVRPDARPSREDTRKTWVSTGTSASPNTKRSMMSADLRPTPGSAISSILVEGTSPPCRSRSVAHIRFKLRAFSR